jgi:hypothetical protein
MSVTAEQVHCKAVSETVNVAVNFQGDLDSGELLTGTPTVVEITTSDLTLANKAVNTAALTILGVSVAIGEAVQFNVVGGTADTTYSIRCTATTDATPAQTRIVIVKLLVVADS